MVAAAVLYPLLFRYPAARPVSHELRRAESMREKVQGRCGRRRLDDVRLEDGRSRMRYKRSGCEMVMVFQKTRQMDVEYKVKANLKV